MAHSHRTLFINRFYAPDQVATAQLLTDLAEEMAQRGEVVVIASAPVRPIEPPLARARSHGGFGRQRGVEMSRRTGVEVLHVRSSRSTAPSMAGKARDYFTFYAGAAWRLWQHARRGDTIVCLTDPPLFALVAAAVAAVKGARLVHWVHDIYPEIAIEITGHRWLAGVRPLRNAAWRAADACVTLGRDMASVLEGAGVHPGRIAIIPNWAPRGVETPPADPAAVRELRRSWGVDDKFVVQYSGNFGRVHDLDPLLEAAELLRDDRRIAFAFVGHGAAREALRAQARARGLQNIEWLDAQPRHHLPVTLRAGDLHAVTLKSGCERYVFPSKLYGITAVGRPVLFIGPRHCELAELVRRGLGVAVSSDRPAEIAEAIRQLAGDKQRCESLSAGSAHFGRETKAEAALAAWRELVHGVDACARPRRAVDPVPQP